MRFILSTSSRRLRFFFVYFPSLSTSYTESLIAWQKLAQVAFDTIWSKHKLMELLLWVRMQTRQEKMISERKLDPATCKTYGSTRVRLICPVLDLGIQSQ